MEEMLLDTLLAGVFKAPNPEAALNFQCADWKIVDASFCGSANTVSTVY